MVYLYILSSAASGQYYVGITEHPVQRLLEHNTSGRNTFTSKYRPWIMVALYACGESLSEAMKIERFIKRQKSRKLVEKLVEGADLEGVLAQLVRVPPVRISVNLRY